MSNTSQQTASNAAARGAALLDSMRPGWADEIDLDRLNIIGSHECILGQLYEGYSHGLKTLFGIPTPVGAAEVNGFIMHGFQGEVAELHSAWKHEVTRRRGKVRVAVIGQTPDEIKTFPEIKPLPWADLIAEAQGLDKREPEETVSTDSFDVTLSAEQVAIITALLSADAGGTALGDSLYKLLQPVARENPDLLEAAHQAIEGRFQINELDTRTELEKAREHLEAKKFRPETAAAIKTLVAAIPDK